MPRRHRPKGAGKFAQINALLPADIKEELLQDLTDRNQTYAAWLHEQVEQFLRPTYERKTVKRTGSEIIVKTEFPDGAVAVDRRKRRRT